MWWLVINCSWTTTTRTNEQTRLKTWGGDTQCSLFLGISEWSFFVLLLGIKNDVKRLTKDLLLFELTTTATQWRHGCSADNDGLWSEFQRFFLAIWERWRCRLMAVWGCAKKGQFDDYPRLIQPIRRVAIYRNMSQWKKFR